MYRFKHALIQEAAYQTLPKGQRQQAHQQIARVLEVGLNAQAIPYWQRAGERDVSQIFAHRLF
jgi:predicted ATPase